MSWQPAVDREKCFSKMLAVASVKLVTKGYKVLSQNLI